MASIEIKSPVADEKIQNGNTVVQGIIKVPLDEYKGDEYYLKLRMIHADDTDANSIPMVNLGFLMSWTKGQDYYIKPFRIVIPSQKTDKAISAELFCDGDSKNLAHDRVTFNRNKPKKVETKNYNRESDTPSKKESKGENKNG